MVNDFIYAHAYSLILPLLLRMGYTVGELQVPIITEANWRASFLMVAMVLISWTEAVISCESTAYSFTMTVAISPSQEK